MTFSKRFVPIALVAMLLFFANGCVSRKRLKGESVQPGVIVEPRKYLAALVGKPAPGFENIKAWKNSKPLDITGLRGRYVLLDFWGYWCGPCVRDIPTLMAISEAFPENKLIVIGVHDDSVATLAEMDEKLATIREKIWMGRDIPYPVALDGKGPTRITGTMVTARGATTAAYGITEFPTVVLIDPSGRVMGRFHAPSLDQKITGLERLLGVPAVKPAWQRRFEAAYGLKGEELLRYIAPPYLAERKDFFFRQFTRWGWFLTLSTDRMPHIPENTLLTWNEQKKQLDGGMNGGELTILEVLRNFDFDEWEFQDDAQLLRRNISGDWVKREGAQRDQLLAPFEKILREKLDLRIRFVAGKVEREVVTATGKFEFHPLSAKYGSNISLYVEQPDPPDSIQGGGGSGDLDSFLNYVGQLGNVRLINKSVSRAGEKLQWRQHTSARRNRFRTNPALFDTLLENLSRQTSLQFQKVRQRENIWTISSDN